MTMSKLLTVLALGLFACAGAQAADNLTQQEKMRACSKGAAGKKGDERRQFMSACLKKGSDVAALTGGKAGAQGAKRPSTKPAQAGS
jgi:hypothetical protein